MYKVLVVDDEKYVRLNVINSLDWNCFNLQVVAQAENGEDALFKIEELKPDIIITDIKMPLIDGIKLIKLVKEKYPQIYFIILSGYDDFQYTKEAIKLGVDNYIKKPVEEKELQETLLKIIEKINLEKNSKQKMNTLIENNQLNQLVHSRILNSELQSELNKKQYAVIIINCRQSKTSCFDINVLLKLSKDYLQYVVPEDIGTFIFQDTFYEDTLSILLNGNSLNSYLLSGMISFLNQHIRVHNFSAAASYVFDGYSSVPDQYKKVTHLLKSAILCSKNIIIDGSEKKLSDKKFTESVYYSLNLINQSIEDRKFNQVNTVLNRIFEDRNKEFFSIELLESVITTLGNTLKKLTILYEVTIKSNKLNCIFNNDFLLQFKDFNELKEYFSSLVNDVFSEFPELSDINIINKILLFITSHYNTELTLTGVASEFYINPSYLSALFKSKTGVNFSSYIEDLRIKKAMDLFKSSETEISDVAVEVGYPDPNYFSKIFKKKVGISPSNFIRNNVSWK